MNTEALLLEAERRRRELINQSLLDFIPRISQGWTPPHHLTPIIHHLDKVANQARTRAQARREGTPLPGLGPLKLAFSVPPQHWKTETVLHWLGLLLGIDDRLRIIYATYNGDLSKRKAVSAQRYAELAGVQGDPRMASKENWGTINGGGIIARGRGGGITGEPADIAVVDDLLKDRKEAESKTTRDDAWDFLVDVIETRLSRTGVLVLFFTRWHEDDPIGRVLKDRGDEFTVIRIPALADGLDTRGREPQRDPLGRGIGEALLPSQRSASDLITLRDNPGTAGTFSALYQGLPRGLGDKKFEDVHWYDELPSGGYKFAYGMDGAYSGKGDSNVLFWGRSYDRRTLYVEGVLQKVCRLQDWIPLVKNQVGDDFVFWRGSGIEGGLTDLFIDVGVNVIFENSGNAKSAHNERMAFAWNEGRVLFPRNASWVTDDFLSQFWDYTGVGHHEVDDAVDALASVFNELCGVGLELLEPQGWLA